MREYLFRGKREDSGEWVFGCYYKQSEFYGDEMDDHIIITSHEDLSFDQALDYYDVQPETVGQFTGMTDKNGKKIFEGDVILYPINIFRTVKFKIEFARGAFWCVTPDGSEAYTFDDNEVVIDEDKCEVIGNIHDNPELLEGYEK